MHWYIAEVCLSIILFYWGSGRELVHACIFNQWKFICIFFCVSFCTPCIQECLKPKKPVCGVCRSTLAHGSRALDLEKQIEMTEATCNGCNQKVWKTDLYLLLHTMNNDANKYTDTLSWWVIAVFTEFKKDWDGEEPIQIFDGNAKRGLNFFHCLYWKCIGNKMH